jgi:hypothetical protein
LERYPPIKDAVDAAIEHWEAVTCIRFRYMTEDAIAHAHRKYILIKKGSTE